MFVLGLYLACIPSIFIQIHVPFRPECLYIAWLLKEFNFLKFFISAEIQLIVSSKQPIVFTMLALVKSVFYSKCFNPIFCLNPVMFVVNNVLITSLNTKYLCNNCSL